jgi:hypothetical protein
MTLVKITEEHIKNGMQGNCAACPGAAAINAVLNPKFRAEVFRERFTISQKSLWGKKVWRGDIPHELFIFMYTFDRMPLGQNTLNDRLLWVCPVEFELDLPQNLLR